MPTTRKTSHTILPTWVDLDLNEEVRVELCDGRAVNVRATAVDVQRNPANDIIRRATVSVEINGQRGEVVCAKYQLPKTIGDAQVECPLTLDYAEGNSRFGLEKTVRLKLWPTGSPWIEPGSMIYPIRQRWMASASQIGNEPTYVNVGSNPRLFGRGRYHEALDFGGAERLDEVIAATDGEVVIAGEATIPDLGDVPISGRDDVVYLKDDRGWYYRYSHMAKIDERIKPGMRVAQGQRLGWLGKQGESGGWAHLHFGIRMKMPSGLWGEDYAYAYVWQAYQEQFHPKLIAIARPHVFQTVGEPVSLDGTRSWSATGKIARYEWTLGDGRSVSKPVVETAYDRTGTYSEILKVTDVAGNVDYDFQIVQIADAKTKMGPPTIHAAFHPSLGIRPGDPVTFLVRSFGMKDGQEEWDFGDGSQPVRVQSDGCVVPEGADGKRDPKVMSEVTLSDGYAKTTHSFEKAGTYLVCVSRTSKNGVTATARLKVVVDEAGG